MMVATLKYISAAMDYQDGAGAGKDQVGRCVKREGG